VGPVGLRPGGIGVSTGTGSVSYYLPLRRRRRAEPVSATAG